MNLPVALPPDTETVTTVSLWRNEAEGSMLMITGTARSSADCPAVASVPSDDETGETVPKLNWIAADKEDKFVHYILADSYGKIWLWMSLGTLLCRKL